MYDAGDRCSASILYDNSLSLDFFPLHGNEKNEMLEKILIIKRTQDMIFFINYMTSFYSQFMLFDNN